MPPFLAVRNWSLRARLAVVLVAASLVPTGIAAWFQIRQDEAQLVREMSQLLAARADQIKFEIDTRHEGYLRAASALARTPETLAFCMLTPAGRTAQRSRDYLGLLAALPQADVNLRGDGLVGRDGGIIAATDASVVGTSLPTRQALATALQGKAVVSDIYLAATPQGERAAIAYLAPVFDKIGGVACVAALWVDAAAFSQPLRRLNGQAGADSYAVLIDHLGIRIAHTLDNSSLYLPAGPIAPAVASALVAENRFGKRTAELLGHVRPLPQQHARATAAEPDPGLFRDVSSVTRKELLGVGRRMESVPWTVFYMAPEQNLSSQLDAARRAQVVLALVITLLGLVLGSVFARSILQPIKALQDATASLATGDTTVRVKSGSNDELGQLASHFNAMAVQLQNHQAELQASNDALQSNVQELERANNDLEAFSYSVSHDLRAPLSVIDGFGSLLAGKNGGGLGDRQLHYVNRIRAGVAQMNQLVEGLLGLSRLGRQALAQADVDIVALVEEVLAELRAEGVLTDDRVSISPNPPHALADRVLLKQVYKNLLSNACKFTGQAEAPAILAGWKQRAGETIYFVRDNGAGFDMAQAAKLFQPFQRMHSDREFHGTGIGLSIVQRIVHRHGGRIWAEAAVGEGASFYFTLRLPA